MEKKEKTFIKDENLLNKLSSHFNVNLNLISQALVIINKTNAQHGIAASGADNQTSAVAH